MKFEIRPYHPSDLSAYYRICLLTGDSGKDASAKYSDPDALGHVYAGPYAVYEADVCFTLTNSGKPCGYIIGAKDSKKFYKKCENEWFPEIRKGYPLPAADDQSYDARINRIIHQEQKMDEDLRDYPAHLHIDLLPAGQGRGMGRKLIETFTENLRKKNVAALHLGVGKANANAVKFYERVGFHIIKETEHAILFGMKLK